MGGLIYVEMSGYCKQIYGCLTREMGGNGKSKKSEWGPR
jgi:hypothetical protein